MARYPLTPRERRRVWLRLGLRAVILAAAALLFFRALLPFLALSLPLLLGAGTALALEPAVRLLERRLRLPRAPASLLCLLLLTALLGTAFLAVLRAVIGELLALLNNWQTLWGGVSAALNRVFPGVSPLTDSAFTFLQERIPLLLDRLTESLSAAPRFAVGVVFFLLSAYFFSSELPRLSRRARSHPIPRLRSAVARVSTPAGRAFWGYFRVQLLLSAVVFGLLGITFLLLRLPYALLLGAGVAAVDLIPMVGAGLILLPWAGLALLEGDSRLALVLVILTVIVWLLHRMLEPRLLGSALGVDPLLLLCALYLGGKLAGAAGAVAGPVLCLLLPYLRRSAALSGARDDLRAALLDLRALLRQLFV